MAIAEWGQSMTGVFLELIVTLPSSWKNCGAVEAVAQFESTDGPFGVLFFLAHMGARSPWLCASCWTHVRIETPRTPAHPATALGG